MIDIVYLHGGDVIKFLGDALLIVFKDPFFRGHYPPHDHSGVNVTRMTWREVIEDYRRRKEKSKTTDLQASSSEALSSSSSVLDIHSFSGFLSVLEPSPPPPPPPMVDVSLSLQGGGGRRGLVRNIIEENPMIYPQMDDDVDEVKCMRCNIPLDVGNVTFCRLGLKLGLGKLGLGKLGVRVRVKVRVRKVRVRVRARVRVRVKVRKVRIRVRVRG
jgi:hypothetical protein